MAFGLFQYVLDPSTMYFTTINNEANLSHSHSPICLSTKITNKRGRKPSLFLTQSMPSIMCTFSRSSLPLQSSRRQLHWATYIVITSSSKQSKLYRTALLYSSTQLSVAGLSRTVTSISEDACIYHLQPITLLSPLCMNLLLWDMQDISAPKLSSNITFGGQASFPLSMPLSQVVPLVSRTK